MIRQDPITHGLYDDESNAEYISITRLIRYCGLKDPFIGVDPAVLEFAAERGKAVEQYAYCRMTGGGSVTMPDLHSGKESLVESVARYTPGVDKWLEDAKPVYEAHQQLAADTEAMIGGEYDLIASIAGKRTLIDLKCTSKEDRLAWMVQVGFFAFAIGVDAVAVLHVMPKRKGGYMWRQYSLDECVGYYVACRQAWMDARAGFERARRAVA